MCFEVTGELLQFQNCNSVIEICSVLYSNGNIILRYMGTLSHFSANFTKRNKCRGFLLASLDD